MALTEEGIAFNDDDDDDDDDDELMTRNTRTEKWESCSKTDKEPFTCFCGFKISHVKLIKTQLIFPVYTVFHFDYKARKLVCLIWTSKQINNAKYIRRDIDTTYVRKIFLSAISRNVIRLEVLIISGSIDNFLFHQEETWRKHNIYLQISHSCRPPSLSQQIVLFILFIYLIIWHTAYEAKAWHK